MTKRCRTRTGEFKKCAGKKSSRNRIGTAAGAAKARAKKAAKRRALMRDLNRPLPPSVARRARRVMGGGRERICHETCRKADGTFGSCGRGRR